MTSIFSLLAIALCTQAAEHNAEIQGVVTDPAGASIPGALIKVLEPDSRAMIATGTSDRTGTFRFGISRPGSYTLTAWRQGFRTAVIDEVVVRREETTVLSKIRLELAGCDAPRVYCDVVESIPPSPHSPEDKVVSRGQLKINLKCGVNLSTGKLYCPVSDREHVADFKIDKDGTRIYLTPLNGAGVSTACDDSTINKNPLRLDGFGVGYDMCIHTHDGRVSRVFLTSEVEPASPDITVHYVTRK